MLHDYGVKKKPITTRNPQANAIVEPVYQTIGDIIQTSSKLLNSMISIWMRIILGKES
jgi:hypothetical protein